MIFQDYSWATTVARFIAKDKDIVEDMLVHIPDTYSTGSSRRFERPLTLEFRCFPSSNMPQRREDDVFCCHIWKVQHFSATYLKDGIYATLAHHSSNSRNRKKPKILNIFVKTKHSLSVEIRAVKRRASC